MAHTANQAWCYALEKVLAHGDEVFPRGLKTKEILCNTVAFDMKYPIVTNIVRKLSYRFMAAEARWIMNGSNKLDHHPEIRSKLEKYSDDGITMSGAYGPKAVDQIKYVVNCLTADKDSRQAIMNIWRENPEPSKDIPCTLSLQFLIRKNQVNELDELNTVVSMRSSDLWMGLPYDMFSFSCISQAIARHLNTRLGNCYITAGSSHLYDTNLEEAVKIELPTFYIAAEPLPTSINLEPILLAASGAKNNLVAKKILTKWCVA